MPRSSTPSTRVETIVDSPPQCPGCGATALLPAGERRDRLVCHRCGRCWEASRDAHGEAREVDTIACSGCDHRVVCESRPTWLVAALSAIHRLDDGTMVLVRPLLYSDRAELAAGYEELSPKSRRLRFFSAPEHLSDRMLEYLTNIDYEDHAAFGAFDLTAAGTPGIGVARYIRLRDEPERAEVAVTVLDRYQGRGLGTILALTLACHALRQGIRCFVSYVLWDNERALAGLREAGARSVQAEPGVVRMEMDLPEDDSLEDLAGLAALRRALRAVAAARSSRAG